MDKPTRPARLHLALIAILGLATAGCAATGETRDTAGDTTSVFVPRTVPRSIPAQGVPPRVIGVNLDTVRAGRFDQGKMWTFEHPPIEYFSQTYNFSADDDWFERARLGSLRIPGCSASFVSPNGLVLTNHHCGRSHATSVSEEGENILDNGYYAEDLVEERRVEGLWADQLVELQDVTVEVEASVAGAETDAERMQARQEALGAIEERIRNQRGEGYHVEIIPLYDGGIYSAYVFRRFTDVRLVFIPELKIGFYGGDPDNFTYPRYTLDMSVFRVYENGRPYTTDHYFPWTNRGVEEGDGVFVIGNPGSTFRLSTISELEFRRDVEEPTILGFYTSKLAALEGFLPQADAETVDQLRNLIFSLQNAQKLYQGTVRALNDPVVFARRRDAQRNFVAAMERDASLRQKYGGLIDEMAEIQAEKVEFAAEFKSFLSLNSQSSLGSATLRRALVVYPFLQQSGAPVEPVLSQLAAVGDQGRGLEEIYLTERFRGFLRNFGEDDPMVREALNGRSPEAAAQFVLSGSRLTSAQSAEAAIREGTLGMDDPAIQLAAAVYPRLQDFRSAMGGLGARESEVASRLGRARFEVYGTDVPPDATFSLRIADGVVMGYPFNGTIAPPYTTMYGLYDHYYSYGPDTPWDLPSNWLPIPADLKLETPLNFVSTNDIIGGNSGSPVLNTDLELVGLVFDGNIESLSGDFIYLTDRARAVSVDARGILESLENVYDADRIVIELTRGNLVRTEAEAESIRND